MRTLLIFAFLTLSTALFSQTRERKMNFPDVDGYQTLKTDLHIHTVFSDGYVWPTIRIDEAEKDGLDAIALTEHIEYQPWKADIPHPDRNRSYEIVSKYAEGKDILVIHGTEITRDMPPGHANAIFVKDVNKINVDDPIEAYREARKQGAFIFWNHPHWKWQQKDGIPVLSDMHQQLIREDLLHGIEVVNDLTFSGEALEIAKDNNITVIGTSDIHGLVDYQYGIAKGGHRPVCLVFARDKSVEAIKEALFAGRTVTWFNEILVGKKENLQLLLDASLSFENNGLQNGTEVLFMKITNTSDARFLLQNTSVYDFYNQGEVVEIPPHSTTALEVLVARSENRKDPLTFNVLNALQGNKDYFKIEVSIQAQ